MISCRIVPLTDLTIFTTPADERLPNRFRSSWDATLRLLREEISKIGGGEVTLELACTALDLRQDGMLRAHAKVTHPGVRLSFDSDLGPLSYATDAFAGRYYGDPPDWQINVRAIALGLQKLRQVDDYGISKRGEQYAGFKALPAGRAMPASHMTRDEALGILGDWGRRLSSLDAIPAEHVNTDRQVLTGLHRAARRAAHPDRNDGDQTAWDQVEQAAAVLGVPR